MPDEFHGDETLFTSYETLSFSLFVMSEKLLIFDVMKFGLTGGGCRLVEVVGPGG